MPLYAFLGVSVYGTIGKILNVPKIGLKTKRTKFIDNALTKCKF